MKKFFTEKNEIKKLELIPGISERIAKSLVKAGFTSENLNAADKEALMTVRGISEKMAEKLIKHFSACKEDGNGKNTHL